MERTMGSEADELSLRMFRTFARFEYALKAVGFHSGDGKAEANWTKFGNAFPDVLNDPISDELKEAVGYFDEKPPQKQVIVGGVLGWSPSPPRTKNKSDEILIYVRRVRNNLFHGGKFNGKWFEPQRSAELLRHSLTILDAFREASEDVNAAYNS